MRPRATNPRTPPLAAQVRIERIGAEGDGVSHLPDGTPLYVPFTLPDESVTARPTHPRGDGWQARADSIAAPSPARVAPPCRHFGSCGGCVLQHLRDAEYRNWKAGLLSRALTQAGFSLPGPLPYSPGLPGERRRIDFAVRRDAARITLGLHEQRSDTVTDITDCLVLHPKLMALIQPLRPVLQGLTAIRRKASVVVNLLDSGPDMLLRSDAPLALDDRLALTNFATGHGLPRVSHSVGNRPPETVALLHPPTTMLTSTTVRPPPGAFLQATAEGQSAIVQAVLDGLPTRGKFRVAELYAGCGTLTFALAERARVAAYEGDPATVAALKQAINQSQQAGRVEAHHRDLARQPLSASELKAFAVAVLDPPHKGAAEQIAQIAVARTATVIYVSCNPAALARDAAVLHRAGYRLTAAAAIDQFLWSARIESVSVFRHGSSASV